MAIRGGMLAQIKARDCRIEAVITRADGTVENLGTVAYWHRNPFKRFARTPFKRAVAHFLRRRFATNSPR